MGKRMLVGFVALAVLGALALGYRERVKEAAARRTLSARPERVIAVRSATPRVGEIADHIYSTGTIRAVKREYLYFETPGRCVFLRQVTDPDGTVRDIREGDRVKKGDLLARLDSRDLEQDLKVEQASMAEAAATLNKAAKDAERQKSLFDDGVISRSDYEAYELERVRAEAAVRTMEARIQKAEIMLENSRIEAPVDGLVAYMNVIKGVYYGEGISGETESEILNDMPFVLLHDTIMELDAEVPASYMGKVKVGQEVYLIRPISLDARREARKKEDVVHMGEVYSVTPAVDPNGRSIRVKIRTNVENEEFLDGQFVACWIISDKAENAVILPYKAVTFEDGVPYCFVVRDGRAERREVVLGIGDEESTQILKGVSPEDRVVVEGNHRLVDGCGIREVGPEAE